jgi:hypothetical protein
MMQMVIDLNANSFKGAAAPPTLIAHISAVQAPIASTV